MCVDDCFCQISYRTYCNKSSNLLVPIYSMNVENNTKPQQFTLFHHTQCPNNYFIFQCMLLSLVTIFEMIYCGSPFLWVQSLLFLFLYYSRVIVIKLVTYYSQNYSSRIDSNRFPVQFTQHSIYLSGNSHALFLVLPIPLQGRSYHQDNRGSCLSKKIRNTHTGWASLSLSHLCIYMYLYYPIAGTSIGISHYCWNSI